MNKRFTSMICALSAAVLLSSCSGFKKTVEVEHQVSAPPKLVIMGDSIAAGYGLEGYTLEDNYHCRSYGNILGEEYSSALAGECGHETVNVAVSGDTSGQLLEHLQSGEFDEALEGSDVVVISIGGNDILGIFLEFLQENLDLSNASENGDVSLSDLNFLGLIGAVNDMQDQMDQSLEGFETNLKAIVSEVKTRTDGDIYFQTVYDPLEYYDDIPMLPGISADKIGKLDKIITDNADCGDTHYYTVVDVFTSFQGQCGDLTNIKSYDIHPNAEGHELIASLLRDEIGKKQYVYTTQEEITDKAKVTRAILIGAACLLALCLLGVGLAFRRKKRERKMS